MTNEEGMEYYNETVPIPMTITELKDEIRRRDEIIESNKSLAAFCISLDDECKRLKHLLDGRDEFIVERGLWQDFVSVCEQYPRRQDETVKKGEP